MFNKKTTCLFADIETVSFEEWNKINEHEISVGNELNKPREKLTEIAKMLQIAKQ